MIQGTAGRTAGSAARLRRRGRPASRADALVQLLPRCVLAHSSVSQAFKRRVGHRCTRSLSVQLHPPAPPPRALHQYVRAGDGVSGPPPPSATTAATATAAAASPQHEDVPIWQIGVAGMAIGLVMGVAAWYFTTPTSAGAQQQHQPRPHPEYQLFFVHPPGKNVDEEEVRRVEMEIQDLEDEFEEHMARLREAQCECEHFEVGHPLGVWQVRSWQDVKDWLSFQAVKWTVETERNILHTIEDKENARIRYKLQLLRGKARAAGGRVAGCREGERCDSRYRQDKA